MKAVKPAGASEGRETGRNHGAWSGAAVTHVG